MTALLHDTATKLPSGSGFKPVLDWIKTRLEARRRRAQEWKDLKRLRQLGELSPDLLADTGVNTTVLYSAFARIVAAHQRHLLSDE